MEYRSTLLSLTCGCALFLTACESSPKNLTIRDSAGNYVTTSDFRAMDRAEFFRSMNAGLEDYDNQLAELRVRSNELGGDTLAEFADCEESLTKKRTDFVNQMAIARNALDDDWPEERSETVDCYEELREALSETYDDVLDR